MYREICIKPAIIIGETALFEPQPSLENSARFALKYTIHFQLLWILQSFVYRPRATALRPTPNLEDQVSVFMSLSGRVAQLYSPAPGSLFVAFYNSQGYGGGIETRLHTGTILYYSLTHS
jgi:hypothetical protein